MVDVELLKYLLNEIRSQYSSKEAKDAIETLLTIHRNILEDEDNIRFRKIKPENQAFSRKVWSCRPAREFMIACGWLEVRELLVFNSDENLIDIIEVLLEHRLTTVPSESEWKVETKHEDLTLPQKRDDELRRKAALQREKELQEYQKDKIYRQQLKEKIKAQIAEDRQNKKVFTKPVVGNKLDRGAKLKTRSPSASDSGNSSR